MKYFTELTAIQFAQYSGKTLDLSKNKKVDFIAVRGLTSSSITINAPTATTIEVEPPHDSYLKKIDVSKCRNAQTLNLYGSFKIHTKTLKLPSYKKNLRSLSLTAIDMKTVNLNQYINLGDIYLYHMNVTKVIANKCKNLKYFYIYECDKIKNIDLSSNKKLIGASSTYCDKMKKSKFKVRNGATLKMDSGKFWLGTKKYQKYAQSICDTEPT